MVDRLKSLLNIGLSGRMSVSILAFYMHKKTKVNANTFIASDTKGIQTGREGVYVCVL